MYSDIMDEYGKIALRQGLIKEAKSEESKEMKKYKNDSYSRAGSDTTKIIENLYNVVPDKPKSQQYEHNIMEIAHPNKVILFNAHDKINGLFENNIERQRIIINLTQKPVNGHLTQHKYAQIDLAKSLMQIANDMDNRGDKEISKLADTCIAQLEKEAIAPLVIAIGAGIAAGAGLVYLKNHSDFKDIGFTRNALRLISELDDIITSGTGILSTRSEYSDVLKEQLKRVQKEIEYVLEAYKKIQSIIEIIETPRTQADIEANGKKMMAQPIFKTTYDLFKAKMADLKPMLESLSKMFAQEDYKHRQIKNEGVWSKINDFMGGVFYGGSGFISDDFDDIRHAIPPLLESADKILNIIKGAVSAEKAAVSQLNQIESAPKDKKPINLSDQIDELSKMFK